MNAENARKEPFLLPFDEYVRMFPSSWLFEHFMKRSGPSSRKVLSSNALADRIKAFSTPESLAKQFEALDPNERLLCSCAYLFGHCGYRSESGESRPDDPLVLSFLLYLARNNEGVLKYFGFSAFEKTLRPHLVKTLVEKGTSEATVTAAVHFPNCMNDIAAIISLAAQGILERKKLGELTKNAVKRICAVIHETPVRQDAEAYAGFLVRFAVSKGMLRADEASFRMMKPAAEEWFALHEDSRTRELRAFAAQDAGPWNTDLLGALLHEAGQSWLRMSLFPEHIVKEALGSLRVLSWVGMIELVKSGSELLFRASTAKKVHREAGDAACKVTLLPDFTAVLLGDIDPGCIFRFGQIGALQSLDRVYKGAIDRTVLNDSLTRGQSGESILAWLAEWGAPANVVTTVREWIREYNRLYISTGAVLIAADERVADEIASYGPLQQTLTRVPAHAVFRINPGATDEVRRLLGSMGFDYRMPHGEEDKAHAPAAEQAAKAEKWQPVTGGNGDKDRNETVLRGKKYGSGLKSFDLNETMNIIDYAILTSQELELDYAGSPLVKKGIYVVHPVSVAAGTEPLLTATDASSRTKQFHVRRIQRIGVGT